MKKLHIFDADGTLRWTTVAGQRYPLAAGEWRLMPNVAERLRAIPWAEDGPWLAVASNQDGVATGEITAALAFSLIEDMLVAALGALPPQTRIAMCTCGEHAACSCRKPAPGMLLALMQHYGVSPTETLFVGDLESDAEAARRAGIDFLRAVAFFS